MICDNAKKLGKLGGDKPPVYCLIAAFFPLLGIFLLRQTAREQYGIEVGIKETFKSLLNFNKLLLFFRKNFFNTSNVFISLQGDMINDVICSVCCGACVNCQTAAEIKARNGGAPPE